jgi:hypothetical protein
VNPPPQSRTLWLADTAFPFQRRKLLDLQILVHDSLVNWLRDTHWIGPTSFITLGQFQGLRQPGNQSSRLDSTFAGIAVLRGEITPSGATLTEVPGTLWASSYSLAENGTTIVFSRGDTLLERVPLAGGVATPVATVPGLLTDVSCRGSTCIVVSAKKFWRVSLTDGTAVALATETDGFARLSPVSTDVVARNITSTEVVSVGTPPRPLGSLFLYKGLIP